jgi:DNA polymerase-3 subunit beta
VKGHSVFTSKLIDGRFPEYSAVIPKGTDRHIKINRAAFTQALQRASILSNEKYRGVRLEAAGGSVKIIAHNPQHEEAIEELEAELNFDQIAIGFNVTYLLDALVAIEGETVIMELKDANSSCLISAETGGHDRHVVMPLKL